MEKFKFLQVVVRTDTDPLGRLTFFDTHFHNQDLGDPVEDDSYYIGKLEADYTGQEAQFTDNYGAEIYRKGTVSLVALSHDAGTVSAGSLEDWTGLKLTEHLEYIARVYLRDFVKEYGAFTLKEYKNSLDLSLNLKNELKRIEEAVDLLRQRRQDARLKAMKKDPYLVYWALSKIASGTVDETDFKIFYSSVPELNDLQDHLPFIKTILRFTIENADDVILNVGTSLNPHED